MATVKIFVFDKDVERDELVNMIKKSSDFDVWCSKFNRYEIVLKYEYFEDIASELKKVFEDNVEEILMKVGKTKVVKTIVCYINTYLKTLEIYSGKERIVEEILGKLESLTGLKFKPLTLSSSSLVKLYKQYGIELRQAIFKNSEGFFYHILKGRNLEKNENYLKYLSNFSDSLRVITFKPKIKYLNGSKYFVTFNADKGTLKYVPPESFKWRPRFELRQIAFLIRHLSLN